MPRPKNAFPAKKLHVALPGEVGSKLDLLLYSSVEQRIPFGAHQRFITDRLREYFDRASCDLAVYFSDMPAPGTVYGDSKTIEALKKALEAQFNSPLFHRRR